MQGFIGSTREGATTTLGFEGSDYTATIIGAAMEAADIQIWKDVSGLMTTDPNLSASARTVRLCSYAEAADLTFFGAKVLHPKAIHPAAQKNIPVHIYNSKRPEAVGTEIIAQTPACANLIKSIAYTRPVTLLHIKYDVTAEGVRASSMNDFLRSVLQAVNQQRLVPLLMAVSSSSVMLAFDSRAVSETGQRDLREELAKFSTVTIETERAIVSLVGEELRSDSTFAGRACQALAATKLGAILHGSSPITLNLVVGESEIETVIARLHAGFFADLDPHFFV